ncbi:MAG: ABC transporter [Desulfotomaculum sp. BICA1-6]|nr:MAG: ABC transporter [Peptococcaceae bacterium BRH_c8a]KJS71246.1 MAG: ABC transporter [Desulfotomaculum sp. BICA1-6]
MDSEVAVMVIELNNVRFTYGCHPVLDGVSLQVTAGEIVGITGPNGAGKTTLLHLIVGLVRPQSGELKLFGVPAGVFKERHQIGFVGQRASHFNRSYPATVYEVVLSGRTALRGFFRFFNREDRICVEEALGRVGMLVYRNVPVGELSGGQQQRVMIARALALRPRLLVMDEPTNGVDNAGIKDLSRLIGGLRDEGITILVVSHEPGWLTGLTSKWVCLDRKICSCNSRVFPREAGWTECLPARSEKIGLGCADSPVGG